MTHSHNDKDVEAAFGIGINTVVEMLLPLIKKYVLKEEGPQVVSKVVDTFFTASADESAVKTGQAGAQYPLEKTNFTAFKRKFHVVVVDDGPVS